MSTVHTVFDKELGYWLNKLNGEMVGPVYPKRAEAVIAGRAFAVEHKAEHSIHRKSGKIKEKNSYGPDNPHSSG